MNYGLLGKDEVRGNVSAYRTPPVRINKYLGATRYSIAHPFPNRPAAAKAILTCRIAEKGYEVGQETIFTSTDMNSASGYSLIIRPFELILYWTGTPTIFNQVPTNGTGLFTSANWDISFVVIG